MIAELLLVAHALTGALQSPPADPPSLVTSKPFVVGERATYDIEYKWGLFRKSAGVGTLEIAGIDTLRARDAYRFLFTLNGGVPGYRMKDTMQSWVDTARFHSLRFIQDFDDDGKERYRHYDMFPDRSVYLERGKTELPSVSNPLDDIAFLYFVRTQPLRVGDTITYRNYFRPESNPVRLIVLKKETISVPAGKFATILVQPIIKTRRGIFSEGGHARMWIADNPSRAIIQLKTDLKIGSVTMKLKTYRPTWQPAVPRS